MVKDKKIQYYTIKDTMSIKISFMHYMEWTKVMFAVVFYEFELVYVFSCSFSLPLSIGKKLSVANTSGVWGGGGEGGCALRLVETFWLVETFH